MSVLPPTRRSRQLLGLHVLADDDPRWKRDPVEQASAACRGGASVVQLRAKLATDREVLDWGARIRALTRDAGVLFFVNDRFDLALLSGADGVHLGQEDVPPDRIPPELRARLLTGRSTHTSEQALAACSEPLDYLAFGPIYGTRSKTSPWSPRGVAALARVVALAAPRAVVAIGGIDAGNAARVARTGAGVAVISAVAGAEDPELATRELARRVADARSPA